MYGRPHGSIGTGLRRYGVRQFTGELHVGVFQRTREAAHAVAVLADVEALGFIEDVPGIAARIAKRLDEREEALDSAFEVDVVFPERIFRANEKRHSRHRWS